MAEPQVTDVKVEIISDLTNVTINLTDDPTAEAGSADTGLLPPRFADAIRDWLGSKTS